jgi:hypothetical protein
MKNRAKKTFFKPIENSLNHFYLYNKASIKIKEIKANPLIKKALFRKRALVINVLLLV